MAATDGIYKGHLLFYTKVYASERDGGALFSFYCAKCNDRVMAQKGQKDFVCPECGHNNGSRTFGHEKPCPRCGEGMGLRGYCMVPLCGPVFTETANGTNSFHKSEISHIRRPHASFFDNKGQIVGHNCCCGTYNELTATACSTCGKRF